MANDSLDINALIASVEAEGAKKTSGTKKSTPVKLPPGLHLDPAGGSINIFGIDSRVPSGFITYVYDDNDNLVGAVSHGKYAPLKQPTKETSKTTKPKPQIDQTAIDTTRLSNYKQAQTLQSTAQDEYNNLMVQAEIIKRGDATPEQKAEFERTARQYQSTMLVIKSAYEKSGAVQGEVHLDPKTGKLAQGIVYTDLSNPSAGQVTSQGNKPSTATTQTPGATNGQAFIPGAPQGAATVTAATTKTTQTGTQAGTNTTTGAGTTITTGIPGQSSGPAFKTVKGVLQQYGQPFTGRYNGKYYKEGVIETPEQIKQDFYTNYSVAAGLIQSDPELQKLFTDAIKNGWSAKEWQQKYEASNWFQSRIPAARASETQRLSDHAAYAESYNNARLELQQTAAALGVTLTDAQLGQAIPQSEYGNLHQLDPSGQNMVEWYLNSGKDANKLNAHLLQIGNINTNATKGQIGATATALKQYAASMGINNMSLPYDTSGLDWFTQYGKNIANKTATMEDAQKYIRDLAKSYFPAFATQIEHGATVQQLATPYVNSVSQLLEVDPSAVDLSSSTGYGAMVRNAMRGTDPANPQATDLATFENQVRSMPQWLDTKNAKQTALDTGTNFLKTIGLIR